MTPTATPTATIAYIEEMEPNDYMEFADALPVNFWGLGSLSDIDDADVFELTITQSGNYDLTFMIIDEEGNEYCEDYFIGLYNSNGDYLECLQDYVTTEGYCFQTLDNYYYLNQGTYYICVEDYEYFYDIMPTLTYAVICEKV